MLFATCRAREGEPRPTRAPQKARNSAKSWKPTKSETDRSQPEGAQRRGAGEVSTRVQESGLEPASPKAQERERTPLKGDQQGAANSRPRWVTNGVATSDPRTIDRCRHEAATLGTRPLGLVLAQPRTGHLRPPTGRSPPLLADDVAPKWNAVTSPRGRSRHRSPIAQRSSG